MALPGSSKSIVQQLQGISFEAVTKGKAGGIEENVKQFIVVPLLHYLGFKDAKDVDYEYKTKSGRADIALLVDGKPKVIVEVKSFEQNLLNHVEQAVGYAHEQQVGFVLLTNGKEFRLFRSFIENVVDPRDRELLKFELRKLEEQIPELKKWISKESLVSKTIDKIAEKQERVIRERVTAPTLIKHLKDAKIILADNSKAKIQDLHPNHEGFRRAVAKWADASRLDINEPEWKDKLAKEIAYSFVNRLYFYKIAEDRKIVKPKLTKSHLKTLEESIELSDIISIAFEEILRIDYHAIFEDQTGILGRYVKFDNEILQRVIYPLLEYNFATIDQDILGTVYQEHISREERKQLGQFYTPEWITDFIVGRMPISIESKILDPACGSGGFLTKCYQKLRQEYERRKFNKDHIHSLILTNNIFGFDINPFAVQLTAMNLALKELDHKTDTINVIETDSLASNLEDWVEQPMASVETSGKRGLKAAFPRKFHVIIGNPPYFDVKSDEIKKRYKNQDYSEILQGKTNIASLFLFRYARALEDGGYLGFVFPKSVLYVEPWKSIRKFVLANFKIEEIYDLREAFEGVLLEQIILILKKTGNVRSDSKVNVIYRSWAAGGKYEEKRHIVRHSEFNENLFPIYLNDINSSIKSKMQVESVPLEEAARLTRGIYVPRAENLLQDQPSSLSDSIIYSGKDLIRYGVRSHKYFDVNSQQIDNSTRKKINELKQEKLMFQGIIGQGRNYIKLTGTYDDGKGLNLDTVVNVILTNNELDQLYLLGVINSRLASYYLNNMIFGHSERTMHFEYVKHLPIKKASKAEQRAVVDKVRKMLDINEQIKDVKSRSSKLPQFEPEFIELKTKELSLQAELAQIEKTIDQKVFSLYGLDKKESSLILDESWT
jgi:type I restriction-modification system DNA methylase subunit